MPRMNLGPCPVCCGCPLGGHGTLWAYAEVSDVDGDPCIGLIELPHIPPPYGPGITDRWNGDTADPECDGCDEDEITVNCLDDGSMEAFINFGIFTGWESSGFSIESTDPLIIKFDMNGTPFINPGDTRTMYVYTVNPGCP